MSLCGSVTLWTPGPTCRPQHALAVSLRLAGATEIAWAVLYAKPPEDWRKIRREIDEGISEPDDEPEFAGRGFAIDQVPALFKPGQTMSVQFGLATLGVEVAEEVDRFIPARIRGKFNPTDPIITVGGHDILGDSEEDKDGVEFHGRAEFSFKLFGYGLPKDMKRYTKLVFDTPRIKQLKEELELHTGQLRQSAYWSW